MTDLLKSASPLIAPDDNASTQFEVFVNKDADKAALDWFENFQAETEEKLDPAAQGATVTGPTPGKEAPAEGSDPDPVVADEGNEPEAEPRSRFLGPLESLTAFHEGAGRLPETLTQVFGGVVDAFDEASTMIEELVGLGGIQIMDENGNLDIKRLTSEEFLKREDSLFKLISPAESDNVEEKFLRSTAQFMSVFLPVLGPLRGLNIAKGAPFATEMVAGSIADFAAFDPHGDRLSTFLNEVPALGSIVPDYLADSDPQNESRWEGRLKNAIEGAGIGLAVEPLLRVFKYYKAAGKAKTQVEAQTAEFDAGRDAIKQAADQDLIEEVQPEALRPLGDPDGDFVIPNTAGDKTLGSALERLESAKQRIRDADAKTGLLGRVKGVVDAVAAKSGAKGGVLADGREVLDDLIDQVRVGVKTPRMAKRPVGASLKALGGIHPDGPLAAELRQVGVTAKNSPGLFRRNDKAIMSGDNLPAAEHPLFVENGFAPEGENVPVQALVDGLRAEADGSPLRTLDEQATIRDLVEPVDQFSQALDELGIDVKSADNEGIKRQLKEVEDEADRLRHSQDAPPIEDTRPEGFDPDVEDLETAVTRTADDLQKEIDEDIMPPVANSYDANGKAITKKQGDIFLNHARIRSAEDVKQALQSMADSDAPNLKAEGVGKRVSNKEQIKASDKEFTDLADLLGRDPGPMSASEAIAARRLLTASGEQVVNLARIAASPSATKEDLFNFRRSTVVHYAVQSEVLKARTETARALQSWSVSMGSNKQAANVVCVL